MYFVSSPIYFFVNITQPNEQQSTEIYFMKKFTRDLIYMKYDMLFYVSFSLFAFLYYVALSAQKKTHI